VGCSPRLGLGPEMGSGLRWRGRAAAQLGGDHLELGSGEVAMPARQQAALGVAVGVHDGGGRLTRLVVARVRQLTAEAAMEARRRSKAEWRGSHAQGARQPWPFYRRRPACFGIKGGRCAMVRRLR
jgi:hypothetical protein